MNYTAVVRRAHVCQAGRLQDSNKFPQKMFIACLHEKFSTRPPEKHQSTPGLQRAPQPKHKHTTATILLRSAATTTLVRTHTLSSSAVLHFLRPFGSSRCEGGGERKGEGEGGREGGMEGKEGQTTLLSWQA